MMWWGLLGLALGGPVAWTGVTLHVGDGTVIEGATLLVDDGRIVDVGVSADVALPEDAVVHDLAGKVVIPGLVDTHSHIASTGDLNEGSGPLQPGLSAIDALDPTLSSIQRAQAGGITTVNVMPGSGNLVGGQTAYLKLRDVGTIDAMLFCEDRRAGVCGGMKMANGTNSRRGSGSYPHTRMASAALVRKMFLDAQKKSSDPDPSKKAKKKAAQPSPPKDAGERALREILDGERVVHFHTHRADDIATAIGLSREFEFDVVLHHVSEAWKVADLIAEHSVPVSLILIDSPGGKEEATEIRMENAALLEDLGVLVSIHTDDAITDSRLFLRSGGLAVRAGMTEQGALAALTASGARQLGLYDRVGSLHVGKDADFVVLSGEPFSVYTQVLQTWVEGELVFDRSRSEDRLHAVGGHGVAGRVPTLEGR